MIQKQDRTAAAFKFKKFIEGLEVAITVLMNNHKNSYQITSDILLFDEKVALFIISHNVGIGGQSLSHEIVMIKPEDVPFSEWQGVIKMLHPAHSGGDTRYMYFIQTCTSILNEKELPSTLGVHQKNRIFSLMQERVEKSFGKYPEHIDKWEVVCVTRQTLYKLSP
ncbi:MAG: hypothetical protein KA007_02860 [Candidatus Pacebacteria bacterium]|nr:hypothetical protein [Candidatus Paceibacterota bacterium]